MKVCIVGGVAGGATAAARLRRLSEDAEIIIFERTAHVSYANCGLPYYIGGEIAEKDELTLHTPESFKKWFSIEVRTENEVTAVNPETKTLEVKNLKDGTVYIETYDKLILSPGAKAALPKAFGLDCRNIFTVRTVEDALFLRSFIEEKNPASAVIVGGGFIGLETAENLVRAGIQTTILLRGKQVMPSLDFDMASGLHPYLREMGVSLLFNESLEGFSEEDGRLLIHRKDREPLSADMVILAAGVVPDTGLAEKAGLLLGSKGSILVNDFLQTSNPDIYAVGDAVTIRNRVSGKDALISLAGPANRQGRWAADNIMGRMRPYRGAAAVSVMKLFDMTAASAGLNETACRDAEIRFDKVIVHAPSHASYYPGAKSMTLKVLFSPTDGRILGAQAVGFDGVDKRIDVLATAIQAGLRAADLEELDLAYAPPYSSAKDPVNLAGYVIENVRQGLVVQFHHDMISKIAEMKDAVFLDIRTPAEYAAGHIKGSVNISFFELRRRIGELDSSKRYFVICQSGLRSYMACRILKEHGFVCSHLSGGYQFYSYVYCKNCYSPDACMCIRGE
ncbi:MAG: CoA-disulfide reductase [Methanocorpusculum parvum]|nr:CoA-disulfide reductase [Methanocorpusculum parvum]